MTVVNSKKLYEHLTKWLRDYISDANADALLIQLDDSIASMVTLLIANDAHHSKNIVAVPDGFKISELCDILNIKKWDADDAIIIGTKTRNECKLLRSYDKYGSGLYDISVVQDIFDSELIDLFNYRIGLDDSLNSFKVDNGPRSIKGFTSDEIEWADNLNRTCEIITDPADPTKNPAWQRFTARQRTVIAKIHQIEKLTKHKEFSHIYYPRVRDLASLVR